MLTSARRWITTSHHGHWSSARPPARRARQFLDTARVARPDLLDITQSREVELLQACALCSVYPIVLQFLRVLLAFYVCSSRTP